MTLSILIVNYNVCYFLEHCLLSIQAAVDHAKLNLTAFEAEILVMDNASEDNSMAYLPGKFPSVRFICSAENLGFSKANNSLLNEAKGEYILFLNPDTLLPHDCFIEQLNFLSALPRAGGCGIRMIDGTGRYLPESKRGFPGLWNSFTKMSGLAGFFPGQPAFNGYYAGNLNPLKNNPVQILSGAYLLVRKMVLDQTGGFDERFFMYAEDIDLSYRFEKAGYKNQYFAGSTIIHFKGESTKKDKEYVDRFYGAMILFVKKHFRGAGGRLYWWLLELAVKGHALVSSKAKPGMDKISRKAVGLPPVVTLKGDLESSRQLKMRLESSLKIFSEEEQEGQVNEPRQGLPVIYCMGSGFSYKELIAAVDSNANPPILIYHPDAGAIIGSHSKNSQGLVYILPSRASGKKG